MHEVTEVRLQHCVLLSQWHTCDMAVAAKTTETSWIKQQQHATSYSPALQPMAATHLQRYSQVGQQPGSCRDLAAYRPKPAAGLQQLP